MDVYKNIFQGMAAIYNRPTSMEAGRLLIKFFNNAGHPRLTKCSELTLSSRIADLAANSKVLVQPHHFCNSGLILCKPLRFRWTFYLNDAQQIYW